MIFLPYLGIKTKTYYFSENVVAPKIEPRTSGSVARNSDHETKILNLVEIRSVVTATRPAAMAFIYR
jgi:hypothetical protein